MIVLLYAAALWVIGVALIVTWLRRDSPARVRQYEDEEQMADVRGRP